MKAATSVKKKPYIRMTRRELVNRLTLRNLPPPLVTSIADSIQAKRKALQSEKRKRRQHYAAWQEVIKPLLKEQASVAARLTRMRKENDADKLSVYEPYASALSKCLGLLRTHQKAGTRTPQEEHAFRNNVSDGKHEIPLGLAWVDWIPTHIQTAMKQAHIKLQKPHTRTLMPLFRRDEDIKRGFMQQHTSVLAKWHEELNKLRDAIDNAPDGTRDYEQRQAALLDIAIKKAAAVPPTKRIHASWNKYVSAKDREEVFREAHPSWQRRVSALPADETPVDWE
jgi:FtsZ-binding cell division protein ZapB